METIGSMKANQAINAKINKNIKDLLAAGKLAFENGMESEVKDIDGVGAYIVNQDEEKYNALQLFQSIINYSGELPVDKLYVIPGAVFGNGDTLATHPLVLPMAKLEELADKAEYLEDKLRDYGLKFPSELFRFTKKNKGKNLPDRDFPAPEPRRMDQTPDEYEAYLEEYYKNHGVTKKEDGLAFRHPYDHEKIDYRKGNKSDDTYTSESFQETQKTKAEGEGKTIKAPIGERLRVTSRTVKGPSLWQRGKDVVETRRNWAKIGSAILKTAAVAAGVVLAGKILGLSPLAWGIVAGGAAVFAVTRYLRKIYDRRKDLREIEQEKAKEKAKQQAQEEGKTKSKEKEKEAGGPGVTVGQTKGPSAGPTTGPTVTQTPGGPTQGGPAPTGFTPSNDGALGPDEVIIQTPFGPMKAHRLTEEEINRRVKENQEKKANGGVTKEEPVITPVEENHEVVPETKESTYDAEFLFQGEQALEMEFQEFARIQAEVQVLVARYQEAMNDPNITAEELTQLRSEIENKQVERAKVSQVMAGIQTEVVDNAGLSRRGR